MVLLTATAQATPIGGVLVIFAAFVFLQAMSLIAKIKDKAAPSQSAEISSAVTSPKPKAQAAGGGVKACMGEVSLNTISDKTAALLIAIIANETDIPIERLKILSIKEDKPEESAKEANLNTKYPFKITKEIKHEI